MAMRGPRHPIGAAPWIVEERTTALHIAQSEAEEFSFSVTNEMDWLNEHMAEIFSENQINVAEIFKTPGKLRGKTPRTARKVNRGDIRAPLTDVFLATPKGVPNPFAISKLTGLQQQQRRNSPTFKVAEDRPTRTSSSPRARPSKAHGTTVETAAPSLNITLHSIHKAPAVARGADAAPSLVDSGYHGSQEMADQDEDDEDVDDLAMSAAKPALQPTRQIVSGLSRAGKAPTTAAPATHSTLTKTSKEPKAAKTATPLVTSPGESSERQPSPSPSQPTMDSSFHSARENPTAEMPPQAATSPADVPTSSSPFVPVKSPSPVRAPKATPPQQKPAPPQPSSPLQSTTPACPPPRELLTAMGQMPAAVSPPAQRAQTPPAAPPSKEHGQHDMADDETEDETEVNEPEEDAEDDIGEDIEDERENTEAVPSPGMGTSPVRPAVRKSSLNFASLPAREPFTSNKSMGGAARLSRTSHIDPARAGYDSRVTGGKSMGNVRSTEAEEKESSHNELDADDVFSSQNAMHAEDDIVSNSKTYTQRLQDRISMLGKSQANGPRPSKSLASHLPGSTQNMLSSLAQQQQQQQQQSQPQPQRLQPPTQSPSPKKNTSPVMAPGAFPEDDDEDWIMPPPDTAMTSPRLNMPKDFGSLDMAEVASSSRPDFVLPKQRQGVVRPASPVRANVLAMSENTARALGHVKSASVPSLPLFAPDALASKKPISVSNPTNASSSGLAVVSETGDLLSSPTKSPSRNFRDSPLRQVKSKLSSIIKSSKGLLASSAAISAEGKSSLLSPSTLRLGLNLAPSTESLVSRHGNANTADIGYPDLSRQIAASKLIADSEYISDQAAVSGEKGSPVRGSPVRTNVRKTRASTERERRELKMREKEEKETQRMTDRLGKLEKEREKEREKARVFSEEQDKIAAMEKQVKAAQKEQNEQKEQLQKQHQQQHQQQLAQDDDDLDLDDFTQRPPAVQEHQRQASSPTRVPAAKTARSSPRKTKAQQPEADADMADPTLSMPPPAHTAALPNASVPRSAQGKRTIRRPVKPTKEGPSKTKQAPTVIRVNTSSSQQQSQFHPSNSALAASLHETLMGPQQSSQSHQLKAKASTASLHTKPSLQSLKSSVSSSGRPKALDLAARRKEQEEREAQRKREYKAEIERKRAVNQEQEEQRRFEQQQKEREAEATRKAAAAAQQRQATIEKAKQTRAPPPAPRTQLPNGPSDHGRSEAASTTGGQQPPRPQSRLATTSGMHRSQEEPPRPVNAVLSNAGKSTSKRPLPATDHAQSHGRSVAAGGGTGNNGNGNVPAYQAKEAKRIRMSEEFDEDELEMGGHVPRVSSIKGPPVRPSGVFKKDLPNKTLYGNGYATAPPSANISRDLFKSTVTAQHNHQLRAGHPLDMAQVSKATISFASNTNVTATATAAATAAASAASSSSAAANPHKTPARPVGMALTSKSTAKSAARSSPRYPNGDGIELPEIQTDDEDSEDDSNVNVAPWADSPDLRRALMQQETMDPMQVFGPPRPLNMEEVFNKSKDRWNKFRARTSSANWSGTDRLTEDDIRKDLAARDKIRREGGWTYELNRDMM